MKISREAFSREMEKVVSLGLAKTDGRGPYPTRRGFDLQNQLVSCWSATCNRRETSWQRSQITAFVHKIFIWNIYYFKKPY